MKAYLPALAAMLLLALPAAAAPTSRQAVLAALEAPRTEPLSGAGWRFLGEGVDVHLASIARDAKLPLATRTRAVWALAAVGGPTADGFFVHTLGTEDVEPPVLAAVLESYVETSRAKEPQRASKVASDHLTHGEPVVRLAAARALERLATPPAGGSPSRSYPSPPK